MIVNVQMTVHLLTQLLRALCLKLCQGQRCIVELLLQLRIMSHLGTRK